MLGQSHQSTPQPGVIFIRNETIDFKGGEQVYFSPFEAFIRAALATSAPFRFVLPVTDKNARFSDPLIEDNVVKVRSARGLFTGLARTPEILRAALGLRAREGINQVVVRVPEHTNLLLLPLLWLFGFQIVIWLVHDRRKVTAADLQQREGLRAVMAGFVSKMTGAVETLFLVRSRVVANGSDLAKRYCSGNARVRVVYSTLVTEAERTEIADYGRAYRHDPGKIRLVFAGRISVEKGIGRLLDFFELLQAQAAAHGIKCHCSIVGKLDDTMRVFLDARLARLPDPSSVKILGFVKRGPDLWRVFSESDYFCLLSAAEGTPRVIPEAFAGGLPVIVSTDANADGVVTERVLVLDNGNCAALAERVVTHFIDSANYLRTRQAVADRAIGYTIERLLTRFGAER